MTAAVAALGPVALARLIAGHISLQRHVGRSAQNNMALKRLFSWLSIGPALSNFIGPLSAGLLIDLGGFTIARGPCA